MVGSTNVTLTGITGSAFAAARDRIRSIIDRDQSNVALSKVALPRLYEHGHAVENAVIFFHGFTNCPQQFDALARRFYERGCNVYVPRLPYHGHADRLTRELSRLTAPALQQDATEAYALAAGLGTAVTAFGLSLGGSMALYLAQTQPLALAVPIAPFFMPRFFARRLGLLTMRALSALPDRYMWWDPRVKEHCPPPYGYPGFTSHSIARCVFFGNQIFEAGRRRTPLAKRSVLVINKDDAAISNSMACRFFASWMRDRANVDRVALDDLGPPRHDIIDLTTFPEAQSLVYPKLEAIMFGH